MTSYLLGAVTKKQSSKDVEQLPATDFQVHTSFLPMLYDYDVSNVSDFTEKKLAKMAHIVSNRKLKSKLNSLLKSYRNGGVAVAWQAGKPIWHKVDMTPVDQSASIKG